MTVTVTLRSPASWLSLGLHRPPGPARTTSSLAIGRSPRSNATDEVVVRFTDEVHR